MEKSKCCKAKVKVITDTDLGRAGTSYYMCCKCGLPCDIINEELDKEEILKLITDEITDAHLNGESTSRLTRLFNNI
jgi:hypothetical protein